MTLSWMFQFYFQDSSVDLTESHQPPWRARCAASGVYDSSFYWYVQYALSLSCSPTPSVSTTALCSIWQFFSGGSPRIRILGVLSVMHEYIHSWVHTRPKDPTDPLSPLILRRLNYYGTKHCICVFSYFSHAGWPLGYIVQETNHYLHLKSAALISLLKEKLNLIVIWLRSQPVKEAVAPTPIPTALSSHRFPL